MTSQRFVAPALLAAALLSGCSKKDKDATAPSDSASASASPKTPTTAAATGSATPSTGSGGPAKLSELVKINFPTPPPKAPAGGRWKEVGEVESDGDRQVIYAVGDANYWYMVNVMDCRHPKAKEVEAKTPKERGQWQWCFAKPDGKIKDHPRLTDPNSLGHGVKVGNIVVLASPYPQVQDKVGDADVDAFLGSLDLAAIAKL